MINFLEFFPVLSYTSVTLVTVFVCEILYF